MNKSAEAYESRPVHVVRHSFELSRSLVDTLALLWRDEVEPMHAYGTKQFAIECSEYSQSKYDEALMEAGREFRSQDVKLFMNESLRLKAINDSMVRIAFQPARQFLFDTLVGDAQKKVQDHAKKHPMLRGVIASSSQKNYLYVDIPALRITDDPLRIIEAREAFASSVTERSNIHSPFVQAHNIIGFDQPARLPVLQPRNEFDPRRR